MRKPQVLSALNGFLATTVFWRDAMVAENVVCSIDGCNRFASYNKMCALHCSRSEKYGDPLALPNRKLPDPSPQRFCTVEGCGLLHKGHGYCSKHLDRFKKHGDANFTTKTERGKPLQFIMSIPETDGCVLWPYGLDTHGYGQLNYEGRMTLAHRLSLLQKQEPSDAGMWALHSCDTPRCVNPKHLYWGTRRQNIDDMVNRDRSSHGEDSLLSKLTESQVREIFEIRKTTTLTQLEIAVKFGVDDSTVGSILSGKSWRRVYDNVGGDESKKKMHRGKLTPEAIAEIKLLHLAGDMTAKSICGKFNIGKSTFYRTVRGTNWLKCFLAPIQESPQQPPTLGG